MTRITAEAGVARSTKKQRNIWLRQELFDAGCDLQKTRKRVMGAHENRSDIFGGLISEGLARIDRATGRVKPSGSILLFHETLDLNQFAIDDGLKRAMDDEARLMLWASDEQHYHLHANKKLCRATGRSLASFRRARWVDVLWERDRRATAAICAEKMETRQPFSMVYRLNLDRGRDTWIFDYAQPRLRPDGSFAGYVGTMTPTNGPDQTGSVIR